jgi:hypothetical protein
MADRKHTTSSPLAQTANTQGTLPLTARAGEFVNNRELLAHIGGKSAVGKRKIGFHTFPPLGTCLENPPCVHPVSLP